MLELKKDGQFLRSSEFTFKEIQPWCHETPKLYHVSDIHVTEESPDTVSICYTFTAPAMPGLKTDVTYIVKSDGYMDVKIHYYGADNRPQLPLLGLRFATPRPAATTEWIGLSGETYPDRKKGGIFGKYSEVPHIPDYLVPQECGCHMDTVHTNS